MIAPRKTLAALSLAALLAPDLASAAAIRMEQRGDEVRVLVDAEGQTLNAFEGRIAVTGARVREARLGESVIPLWTVRPSAGDASFAGIVPGGYEGSRGLLFSLILEGPAGTQVTLRPENVGLLLNDGLGTAAAISAEPATFTLSGAGRAGIEDTEIPEFSEVVISRDEALFGGAWFVAFNAQDAESGVARYQVAEDRLGLGRASMQWRDATSPHLLEDQSRESTVHVKAIDGAGNEAIFSLAPESPAAPYGAAALAAVLLLVVVLAILALLRRGRGK